MKTIVKHSLVAELDYARLQHISIFYE